MGSNTWEDLRREARKLEAQLDAKVASYAKLSSGSVSDVPLTSAIETRRLLNDSSSSSSSGTSLGTNTSSGAASKSSATKSYLDTVTAMSSEIEQLLGHLSNVNSAMENIVTSSGVADSSRTHTLARHGDILMDFSQEFRRLNAANIHLQNRNALLNDQQPSGKSKNPNNGSGSENDGNDHLALNIGGTSNYSLLRERSTIYNAQERMDEVINSAQATMSNISQQRGLFTDIGGKINTIGAKFPVLNNIMGSIRRKKSKDTIILASVVCGCTLFLLIYWLSK